MGNYSLHWQIKKNYKSYEILSAARSWEVCLEWMFYSFTLQHTHTLSLQLQLKFTVFRCRYYQIGKKVFHDVNFFLH